MSETLPTFLVIGAQKSGTTTLYHWLSQHPDVHMAAKKEPHFFCWEGRTEDLPGPNGAQIRAEAVSTLAEYQTLFHGGEQARARGEASTGYLPTAHCVPRIRHHVPDVQLVAMLRNPVDRAWSGYQHARRQGAEDRASFAEALAAEPERVAAGWTGMTHYVRTGMYHEQLQIFLEHFPSEQLRIYFHDDLTRDPTRVMTDLFGWIGVDDGFRPDMETQHNVGREVRSPGIERWARTSALARWARERIPDGAARRAYAAVNERGRTQMTAETRGQLVDRFRDSVHALSTAVGRDLSPWLAGDRLEAGPGHVGFHLT